MNAFLEGIDEEIEEHKKKTEIKTPKSIASLWQNRKISPEEREKFIAVFKKADIHNHGYLSAEIVMKMLGRSKLDAIVLTHIFTMSDLDQDQKLNLEEFIISMYLVQCKMNGEELPETLPESLCPPRPKMTKKIVYTAIPGPPPDLDGQPTGIGPLKRDLSALKMGKNTGSGPSYKIVVVGDQCGKSSIVSRFLFDEFSPHSEPTVEDNYEYNYQFDGKECHLRILDTSGNEFYVDSMHPKWFANASGFMYVYSITSSSSLQQLEGYRSYVMKFMKDDRTPGLVVGTQADREDARQVTKEQGMWWASRHGYAWMEVSAKSGEGIEEAFKALINRMNMAREKGVTEPKPHRWKKANFSAPTNCKHCNKLLFGLVFKYGMVCNICNYPAHKKCSELVPPNCTGIKASNTGPSKRISMAEAIQEISHEELYNTLHDNEACQEFRTFLEKKGTGAVHVAFYTTVEDYKALTNYFERKTKGNMIYNSYFFKVNPIHDLKIPDRYLKDLKANVVAERFDTGLFDEVQKAVYDQISKQFFPEFVKDRMANTFKDLNSGGPQEALTVFDAKDDLIEFLDELEKDKATAAQEVKTEPPHPEVRHEPISKQVSLPEFKESDFPSEAPKPKLTPPTPVTQLGHTDPPKPKSDPISKDWYYGNISRIEAEKILLSCGYDAFLVRTSSVEGCYALSKYFSQGKSFIHFIIAPSKQGYGIKDCKEDPGFYPSLEDLINNSPITKNTQSAGKKV